MCGGWWARGFVLTGLTGFTRFCFGRVEHGERVDGRGNVDEDNFDMVLTQRHRDSEFLGHGAKPQLKNPLCLRASVISYRQEHVERVGRARCPHRADGHLTVTTKSALPTLPSAEIAGYGLNIVCDSTS